MSNKIAYFMDNLNSLNRNKLGIDEQVSKVKQKLNNCTIRSRSIFLRLSSTQSDDNIGKSVYS